MAATSGSVGPNAPDEVRAILAEFDLQGRVHDAAAEGVEACLRAALAARPDLLIVLAGDGTARAAAEMAGPRGPLIVSRRSSCFPQHPSHARCKACVCC